VQAVTSYRRALDTFVIELDGIPRGVQKGAILAESDPVVQHDLAHGELLFAALDTSEDEKAPDKSGPAKDGPAAEKAAAVKDSPKADPPKPAAARTGKGPA
jgi:hypothetical protein